jgi:hypothetical protein
MAINAQPLEKVKLAAQRLTWRANAALAVHETPGYRTQCLG